MGWGRGYTIHVHVVGSTTYCTPTPAPADSVAGPLVVIHCVRDDVHFEGGGAVCGRRGSARKKRKQTRHLTLFLTADGNVLSLLDGVEKHPAVAVGGGAHDTGLVACVGGTWRAGARLMRGSSSRQCLWLAHTYLRCQRSPCCSCRLGRPWWLCWRWTGPGSWTGCRRTPGTGRSRIPRPAGCRWSTCRQQRRQHITYQGQLATPGFSTCHSHL